MSEDEDWHELPPVTHPARERLTDEQLYAMTVNLTPFKGHAREQAMRMDIINKGGSPDHVLGQKLGGSEELLALRARVAKLEAALKLATDFLEDVQDGLRLNGWGKELAELFVALKDAPQ